MRIPGAGNSKNFGNALSTRQEQEQKKLIQEVREALGHEDAISVGKIYAAGNPSAEGQDTGVGKINSDETFRMCELLQVYAGANAIKSFPAGQLGSRPAYTDKGYYGSYQRSAMTLGEDNINLFNLTKPEYGSILPEAEAKKFADKHAANGVGENKIDYANELDRQDPENYPINEPLKVAFENFKTMKPTPELKALRAEFETYKTTKEPVDIDDIQTRAALFPTLRKEGKLDFFQGFDKDPAVRAQKMPEFEQMKKDHAEEIEFFKFKQFLAEKEFAAAKKELNDKGMDLFVDMAIGFSWAEECMYPDAFLDGNNGHKASLGWGLPVLDVESLVGKDDSPAHKLLRDKTALNLMRADGIRFDVGWSYMKPLFDKGNGMQHMEATSKIVHMFEDTAEQIKGKDFDQRKLVYECDANTTDMDMIKNKELFKDIKGMMVLTMVEERNDAQNIGWKNTRFLKEQVGLTDDQMLIGTNNHDRESVIECAETPQIREENVGALMRVFDTPDWTLFKDNNNVQENNRKFTVGKFAECFNVKNQFTFYNDVLGRRDKVDTHWKAPVEDEYRCRLERNYEENYHKAVQDGYGLNLMDTYRFIMERRGMDKTNPELYAKVKAFGAYLAEKGGIYSREQADAIEAKEGYKEIK
ncbi:MAG: 4-alpha-glucanotransferase [Candidatus Gastranaerophilales bacterium]|nr:4-alpha-glucanotransferase [Candidatus Gastranaerophilales bacterium]